MICNFAKILLIILFRLELYQILQLNKKSFIENTLLNNIHLHLVLQ